jgi:tellurite resistance protein
MTHENLGMVYSAGDGWAVVFWIFVIGAWIWSKASENNEAGSGYSSGGSSVGNFEIRTSQVMRGDNKDLRVISIEARGRIPVNYSTDVQFVCVAQDVTDKSDGEPLISTLDDFKFPKSGIFQSRRNGGRIEPDVYFKNWVEVGVMLPDHVVAPKSGVRRLKFTCAMTPTGNLDITYAIDHTNGTYDLSQVGYNELDEKRMEAIGLSLDLGVAIAYSDGSLDRSEAKAISDWLRNKLDMFDDETKPKARTQLNDALRSAFERAAASKLTVNASLAKLKASKVRNAVNDALELSSIVIAADGAIAESEMAMLRSFAKELGVNLEDLQNIADKHVAGAKATTTDKSEVSDESLIGLDPKADKLAIKKALIDAFGKYNSRLQTEKDPARRVYFQDMLNAVARLRKKYA